MMDTISTIVRAAVRGRRSHGIGARYGRTDHLARFAKCAGQARDDRAGVLRARRIYPARHRPCRLVTAYVTKGEIRSQLAGGPVETFKVGSSFFEPPGATHLGIGECEQQEPAELIAVFVADEARSSRRLSSKPRGGRIAGSSRQRQPVGLTRR